MRASSGLRAKNFSLNNMLQRRERSELAELLPNAELIELIELDDCRTLIPIDQPAQLAKALRDFTAFG